MAYSLFISFILCAQSDKSDLPKDTKNPEKDGKGRFIKDGKSVSNKDKAKNMPLDVDKFVNMFSLSARQQKETMSELESASTVCLSLLYETGYALLHTFSICHDKVSTVA